jgi:hypothetical protein
MSNKWVYRNRVEVVEAAERDIFLKYVKNNCAKLIADSSDSGIDRLFGYPRGNKVYTRKYELYLRAGIAYLVPRAFVRFHYDKRVGVATIEMSWADFNALYGIWFGKNGHGKGEVSLEESVRVASCGTVA